MYRTILWATLIIFLMILLISFPDQALKSSIRGLDMWFQIVFPSLLPFFVVAELFIAFGVVHFLGTILEPLMRPIFNVPGAGSFALIIGLASGYPVGAKITVRLRENNDLTQIEAERLISFTNAASPLFIFGAIAVGFFHDPSLGLLIAVAHYTGNIIVGIMMRYYGMSFETSLKKQSNLSIQGNIFKRAFKAMHQAQKDDGRPIGQLLGDAILTSVQTLVIVGGFIIIFSVLNELLFTVGIAHIISLFLSILLYAAQLPTDLNVSLLAGLFEITSGAEKMSQIETGTLKEKLIIIGFMLGFNSFSVQAQVASLITTTDIRFKPYFLARLFHGCISGLLTWLLYNTFYKNKQYSQKSHIETLQIDQYNYWSEIIQLLKIYGPTITLFTVFIALCIYVRTYFQQLQN